MAKEREDTSNKGGDEIPDLDELLAAQARTRQKYERAADPPIVVPELPPETRQKILELFGEPDPGPKTSQQILQEYFSRPEDPEVVRKRIKAGEYWKKLYEEGLKQGHFGT